MRKAIVYLIALGAFALVAGPAVADTVIIGGKHSAKEIETTCKKNGGTFSGVDKDLGTYGCHKGDNIVSCGKDGKCVGCTNCTKKEAAGGATGKGTIGGVLANAPAGKIQPLTPQKVTRSPATAPNQPLKPQKVTRSPTNTPTKPLTSSPSFRRGAR